MTSPHTNICVTTLGGQPQVVSLTIDALLARGILIDEVVVVHLALDNPRYRAAQEQLAHEFQDGCYARRIRYVPLLVRHGGRPVIDLDNEHALDAALATFDELFTDLRRQQAIIHLCLSGGRRLLGHLAVSVAQQHFSYTDCLWHLFSPDDVREQTHDGLRMHLDDMMRVRLIRVRLPGLPASRAAANPLPPPLDPAEYRRCQQVDELLNQRPRQVLRAFARGLTPQQVADELCIALGTVNDHKTTILDHCRNIWELEPTDRPDYHWLYRHFARYFQV